MTRTIKTDEAIEKCYRVVLLNANPDTNKQCAAWLETLRLLKALGFERVAFDHIKEKL